MVNGIIQSITGKCKLYLFPPPNVNVEEVKGYLAFAKDELAIKNDLALAQIFLKLSETIHPLIIGQVYRLKAQIKMLAEKLIINQVSDPAKVKQIISFLCSDSGGHNYTINRREAHDTLGLNITEPDDEMYTIIKNIYDDIDNDLGLSIPYNLQELSKINNGDYSIKRTLIESTIGGCNYFLSEGKISVIPSQPKNTAPVITTKNQINHEIYFEGWKYEEVPNA
ncbi:MAG: hypothetical protein LBS60_02330 [Deltaproteobacteria bacterium]|jgi:hypothetical protein|nr:hypothetical protein [Deltaproteobacteria bacterium]